MTMLEERVSSVEGAYEHLATKADVQELRGEMNTAIEKLRGDLRTDMETMRGDLRTEMEAMRGDLLAQMRASETRLVKWNAGMMIGALVAVAALLRLFV